MQTSSEAPDRRRFARQPACLPADYISDTLEVRAPVADLCEGGAFVEAATLDTPGARMFLVISCFPAQEYVFASGRVVRTVERAPGRGLTGMAIRFDPLPLASRARVESYCECFARLWRVAVVDDDEARARRLGEQIERVAVMPTWLPARELDLATLLRLRPHVVVVRWPDHVLHAAAVLESLRREKPTVRLPVLLTARRGSGGAPGHVLADEAVPTRLLDLLADAPRRWQGL